MYKPSFDITSKMLSLCISITEKVGRINSFQSLKRMPILRKNNRIKSIHSSLAIEANSLSKRTRRLLPQYNRWKMNCT